MREELTPTEIALWASVYANVMGQNDMYEIADRRRRYDEPDYHQMSRAYQRENRDRMRCAIDAANAAVDLLRAAIGPQGANASDSYRMWKLNGRGPQLREEPVRAKPERCDVCGGTPCSMGDCDK